jgi:hypothetical protein
MTLEQGTGSLKHHQPLLRIVAVQGHLGGLNDLAAVLRDQNDLPAARALLERAQGIREASLGPNHPDTALSRQMLATVLEALENGS